MCADTKKHDLDDGSSAEAAARPFMPTWCHRMLAVLLLLTVVVPAFTVTWVVEDGRFVSVLYREPKLIVVTILAWILVSAFVWCTWRQLSIAELRQTLWRRPVFVLGGFLGYLATTGLWVRVPQNYLYELNQYLLLFVLLVVLLIWHDREPAVRALVRGGLVAGLAVVTVVGLLQLIVPIPFLSPINPQIGAGNPSFMGYKNPAALAVLGQVFLLAQLLVTATRRAHRLLLGALLAAELGYIVSLGSRTSYAATGVAVVFLVILWWLRAPTVRRSLRGLLVGCAALLLFAAALAIHAPVRQRAESLVAFVAHPSSYFESDRGVYLLNTLNMVRHRPLGVGLGDWQTHYPVYRLHDPSRSFTPRFQVRRAHSDHVQFLGEAGWPGLALWISFLAVLVWTTAREYVSTGRWGPFCVSGQVVALAAAMATDYVVEMPFHKAQFFLVVFLACATHQPGPRLKAPGRSRAFLVAAVVVSLLALGQIVFHLGLAHKLDHAVRMERSYAFALRAPAERAPRVFDELCLLGVQFASRPGHVKTFHKNWFILAHSAHRLGRQELAVEAAGQALELHPNHPPTYLLLSRLQEEPEASRRWLEAYEYLMRGPTDGADGSVGPSCRGDNEPSSG